MSTRLIINSTNARYRKCGGNIADVGRADDCPARDRGSSFSWRDRMIRFIAGIRSPKHLAASWSGVRGNGGEAEVG